jgi:RimJ/RimL family protein N-acetyltransferase
MLIRKGDFAIREATIEDAKQLNIWWNDGRVMAHAGFPNGLKQEISKTIDLIDYYNKSTSYLFVLVKDEISIGEMSARVNKEDGFVEVGIKICDFAYQDKGYGKNYMSMLLDFIFTNKDLEAIDMIKLDTSVSNLRARHFYEKMGFTCLGVNSKPWFNQLGEEQFSVDFVMTRENFLKREK